MMGNKINISGLTLLLFCLVACSHPPLPNTFLIPANYKGTLRVVFDENWGTKPKVVNGRQILEFQKDPIIILNSEFFNSGKNDEYYLVDNEGNKTMVTQISTINQRLNNMPSILAGTVTVSGYTYHNSKVEVKGITYQDFHLYNKDTNEFSEDISSLKIDALTKDAVSACRTSK
jgi:hypothetical protein